MTNESERGGGSAVQLLAGVLEAARMDGLAKPPAATREEQRAKSLDALARGRARREAERRAGLEADRERTGWVVLGVDPGERGAVALIRAWPGQDRPQLEALGDAGDRMRLRQLAPEADLVVIERQQASPQMGVSSAFSLGRASGRLEEALQASGARRVVEVAPARWKASYGLPGGAAGKVAGVGLVEMLLGTMGAVQRHDEAEAVLLAWWGWRNVLSAQNLHRGCG